MAFGKFLSGWCEFVNIVIWLSLANSCHSFSVQPIIFPNCFLTNTSMCCKKSLISSISSLSSTFKGRDIDVINETLFGINPYITRKVYSSFIESIFLIPWKRWMSRLLTFQWISKLCLGRFSQKIFMGFYLNKLLIRKCLWSVSLFYTVMVPAGDT